MKTKTYLALLICLLIMLLIGCDRNNTNSGNSNITKPQNIDSQSKDNELLYGKYPEPILIAIGENNDVKKDYKELTRGDLKKIRKLFFHKEYGFNYVGKKYGFKENEEYDFSIIAEMPNLESLSIGFGTSKIRLKDYSILKKLNSLKYLTISNIHDSDMDNITALKSLKCLSILYSDITNIDWLEELYQLDTFTLDYCYNIKNLEALRYLKNIGIINLSNMNITEKELSTFPDLPTLTSLGLVGNNLSNLTDFPILTNLESLVICENPLNNIKIPLNNLPKIKYLSISETLISDANKIQGMDNIEVIYMYDTKITKVEPFKKYKNLKSINTRLDDIEDKETLDGTGILIIED